MSDNDATSTICMLDAALDAERAESARLRAALAEAERERDAARGEAELYAEARYALDRSRDRVAELEDALQAWLHHDCMGHGCDDPHHARAAALLASGGERAKCETCGGKGWRFAEKPVDGGRALRTEPCPDCVTSFKRNCDPGSWGEPVSVARKGALSSSRGDTGGGRAPGSEAKGVRT